MRKIRDAAIGPCVVYLSQGIYCNKPVGKRVWHTATETREEEKETQGMTGVNECSARGTRVDVC